MKKPQKLQFTPGENCWKLAKAQRISFLVDGEDYFSALADACEVARHQIIIIGWDIASKIRLRRKNSANNEDLGDFLERLAEENPELHIYILEWDFSMLYSLERETWPLLRFSWQSNERIHFELDDEHPVGASHHQKIIVVDDCLAFVGGFDLARCRWDTSAHAPDDDRRQDNGATYGPFHDMQMLVDGEAARQLGQLARQRWERGTGELIPEMQQEGAEEGRTEWPETIRVDLQDAEVAILRTDPEHDGRSEVREIEKFYLNAIAAAKRHIYIENQYLSSDRVGTALVEALQKDDGPEILIVLPERCSGWLEQETMGALRDRLICRLRSADRQHRLKICFPAHAGLDDDVINVHSKLLIVDDQLLTLGSANLNNRSMGFDTECNLALSAAGQEQIVEGIRSFRNRLLAEHLGTEAEKIAEAHKDSGSLLQAVADLNQGKRSLQNLPDPEESSFSDVLSADMIVDPERPVNFDDLLEYLEIGTTESSEELPLRKKAWRFTAVLAMATVMAILWRWSPLHDVLNLETLLETADTLQQSIFAIPIVLLIYIVGSCLMFPITLMILVTALSFGPYTGFFLALVGSLLGGLASYLLGHWLGRDVVRKLAGKKINRLSRKMARRGWIAIALVRAIPIAPYTIINMVAGATHISARSFLIGTAIGMGPGILAIMIFEGGLQRAIEEPGPWSIALAILAFIGAVLIIYFGRRWLRHQEETDND